MVHPGDQVAGYDVVELLGEGGMARVWKVTAKDGTARALKVVFVDRPDVRSRLLDEGRVQSTLDHPNVVRVTDIIEVDGHPALVMEHVDGPCLYDWLEFYRPSMTEAVDIFRGIVLGVRAAHRADVTHRDLKPENVLLASDADSVVPKVTDFGLVKLLRDADDPMQTAIGSKLGTAEYMAPEQIEDSSTVDHRADMFALGCLLYELCTGRSAFAGRSEMVIWDKILGGEWERPAEVPPGIVAVMEKLLVVDRAHRLSDCDVLLQHLDAIDMAPHAPPSIDDPEATRPPVTLAPDDPTPTPAQLRRSSARISMAGMEAVRKAPPWYARRTVLAAGVAGGVMVMAALFVGLTLLTLVLVALLMWLA